MRLTQDRILDIVRAAQAMQDGYEGILNHLKNILQSAMTGQTSKEDLISELTPLQYLYQPNMEHYVLIGKEDQHFKEHYRNNVRAAQRIAARREFGLSADRMVPTQRVAQRLQGGSGDVETPPPSHSLGNPPAETPFIEPSGPIRRSSNHPPAPSPISQEKSPASNPHQALNSHLQAARNEPKVFDNPLAKPKVISPSDQHPSFTKGTYGNGEVEYEFEPTPQFDLKKPLF